MTGRLARRLHALMREHITIAVREYPAALRLLLVPREWPAATAGADQGPQAAPRSASPARSDQASLGDFTVTGIDPVLQCMHAAMSQAPLCASLEDRPIDEAIDELTGTLMMLVGELPFPRA